MKCPFCSYEEQKVIDSRPVEESNSIRRRRECLKCQKRFTTYEKVESVSIMVIKKDKTREDFDRDKLLNGLIRACQKRPVSVQQLENIVNEIEFQISNSLDREVTSQHIGELVMAKAKEKNLAITPVDSEHSASPRMALTANSAGVCSIISSTPLSPP